MKKIRKFAVLIFTLSIIFMCFTFTACSGSGKSENNGYSQPSNDKQGYSEEIASDIPIITTSDRMLAYSVNVTIAVDDINVAMDVASAKVDELGGWQESGTANYSYGRIRWVYRVPTSKINEFLTSIQGTGKVQDKTVDTIDLTELYRTAKVEKESLEARKAALLKMLGREDITLDDEIKIEKELAQIDKELNSYNSSMDGYKEQSEYSKITVVYVQTKENQKEESFWDKLGDVFMGSGSSIGKVFGWILMAIVAILPYFAIVAGLFGLYVLIKFIVCKKKKIPFVLFKGLKERKEYIKRIKEKKYAEMNDKNKTPIKEETKKDESVCDTEE